MTHKSLKPFSAAKLSAAIFLALIFSPIIVKADVTLLLEEALGMAGEASSAGHISIYFSNICADNPIKMRLCRPGERGIVISTYPNFGTDKQYEWIGIPLLPFLYGVEDEKLIPIYTNGEIRTLLREQYRQRHLREFVPDTADGSEPEGHWKSMLVNSFNRDIYCFTVKTTITQDEEILEKLGDRSNESHFSAMYNNCADFARDILNTYFPNATHRDVLNDLTMTNPKAIAKSFTRYARKREDLLFNITKFPQLAGPIRRSMDNRHYSEHALFSKKYLAPQLLFNHIPIIFFSTVYFTTGLFSVNGNYVEYATPEIAQLNLAARQLKQQKHGNEPVFASFGDDQVGTGEAAPHAGLNELREMKDSVRRRIFGTKEGWQNYKAEFAPLLQKAIADGLFLNDKEVKTFFRDLELQSEPTFDDNGELMLKVEAYGENYLLGLTRGNILSSNSNRELAYKLMLAKINATLKSKEKNRESLETFVADWNLMKQLSESYSSTAVTSQSRPRRFLVHPEKTTFGQKFKKVFVLITH